jgi:hypothetical protein
MDAVYDVFFVGVKVIYTFCEPPGGTEADVGLTAKLDLFEAILVIDNVLPPALLTVTESFLLVPTVTVPKFMVDGVTEKSGPPLLVVKLQVDEYALVPALLDALTCQ